MAKRKVLTVFEHDILRVDNGLDTRSFRALALFHDKICDSYFELGYDCIKLKNYVGILRVEDLTIEVLPKIDREGYGKGVELWRTALLEMLAASGFLRSDILPNALQRIGETSLLDIIALQFLTELETLVREGLLRKYRRETGNVSALRGKLLFSRHVKCNLTSPDKWFTEHSAYDRNHALNGMLRCALEVLYPNCSAVMKTRLAAIRLNFIDIPNFHPNSSFIESLTYDRRTERYRKSVDLAWLILRDISPQLRFGQKSVFAIMFDMNALFERTVLHLLTLEAQRRNDGTVILGQESHRFWNRMFLRPDIVIKRGKQSIVIDTKWKMPSSGVPSEQDLRQVFAYGLYFSAKKTILLYPGSGSESGQSAFFEPIPASPGTAVQCETHFARLVSLSGHLNRNFAPNYFSSLGLL